MCRAEDQQLEEGWIIPSSNICSNSAHAIFSLSGAKRRVRAKVGGPEVSIQ